MPLRFRRSVRFAPGVRLNIGENGLSATVGRRGAHVTFGHGRTTTSFRVPGTGVSWTSTSYRRPIARRGITLGQWLFALVVFMGLAAWFGWL
jgi:hypothetical protein